MRLEKDSMFNFLKKTSQKANSTNSHIIDVEQPYKQANKDSISQKLDKTAKLLDKKTNQSNKSSRKHKDDLIKHALEVQKSQSKLLDNLDEKTKKRMKAMALQLMIFKKRD